MSPCLWSKSLFIAVGLFATVGCHTAGFVSTSPNITDVYVDVAHIYYDAKSNGDTWDYIYADDDNLYSFGCDGKGYGATNAMNLNFNCLKASDWNDLTGQLVNPMNEYGLNGAYLADNSTNLLGRDWSKIPRGANWKVTGADCIDNVFYNPVVEGNFSQLSVFHCLVTGFPEYQAKAVLEW